MEAVTDPFGAESSPASRYAGWRRILEAVTDPFPRGAEGSQRVFRGGCYFFFASGCRSAYRIRGLPSYRGHDGGFRVALSSPSGIPK
jgi:formylglycine-generating enzyme required for sulfatase activity